MDRDSTIKGKVWVIKDDRGNTIDNIDTDQIYHNQYLTITDKQEMKNFCFSNLKGWKDFPEKGKPGDILVVGNNFGAGSSRQQAVDCFYSLGIVLIIGESFGAIYKRNAINSGFPILECSHITQILESGDRITIDLLQGKIQIHKTGNTTDCKPFSKIQWEIYRAGGLFNIKLQ